MTRTREEARPAKITEAAFSGHAFAWQEVYVQPLFGDAVIPTLTHDNDVGYDLYLAEDVTIESGERRDVNCGVAIAMPDWLYGRITGRSSSVRKGLLVHEGIIDPGYRGPLLAYVTNLNEDTISLDKGDRVAQLIFAPAIRPALVSTYKLPKSGRGTKGLGSSGS